ncbi:MAG: Y-family DNA polymerase [Bacteriovoracaceae bacterium]
MKPYIFALMDCNSFYCSCERVFRPDLKRKPIIVLSNNDGCAVSITPEAKALGIKMGGPFFEMRDLIRKHNISVFSSNYTLYGDLSSRVMSLLSSFTPDLEIYSIDEAFLDFSTLTHFNLIEYSHHIRNLVEQRTGIPISIGLGPTKVLAKLANHIVKKNRIIGVFSLLDPQVREEVLSTFPIEDIWGIGRKSAAKLKVYGIKTAKDFRDFNNDKLIQSILTKTGRKIQDELRGISCIFLTEMDDKKVIASTRSFGTPIYEKSEIREAVASYITQAAEKMRKQNNLCMALSVYIRTSHFKENFSCGQRSHSFHLPTDDTLELIKAGMDIVDAIFQRGVPYRKAGIFLFDMTPKGAQQLDLLSAPPKQGNEKLMSLIDQINQRYGKQTIKSAACGTKSLWAMLSDYKSPSYTTSWKEILKVG